MCDQCDQATTQQGLSFDRRFADFEAASLCDITDRQQVGTGEAMGRLRQAPLAFEANEVGRCEADSQGRLADR